MTIHNGSAFKGLLAVNQGMLSLTQANSFENAGAVNLAEGAGIDTRGTNQTFNALSGGNNTSITALAGIVTLNNGMGVDTTFAGTLSGAGTYVKSGAGALNLTADSHVGRFTVNAGALNISRGQTVTVDNLLNVASGAVLGLTVSGTPGVVAAQASFAAGSVIDIKGLDAVQPDTDYTLVRTSAGVSGSFNVTVNGMALSSIVDEDVYVTGNALVSGNDIVARLGLVWNNTAAGTAHGTFNIGAGESFAVGSALADNTVAIAPIGGWNGQDLTKKGLGSLTLNAANTYTGVTDVQAGGLVLAQDNALASSSRVQLATNTVLDTQATDQVIQALTGQSTSTFKSSGGSLTLSDGSGFYGAAVVESGVLALTQADSFNNAGSVKLADHAGLDTQGNNQTLNGLSGGAGSSVSASGGILTLNNGAGVNTVMSGEMNAAGAVVNKTGSGTLVLAQGASTSQLNLADGRMDIGKDKTFTVTNNASIGSTAVLGVTAGTAPALNADTINFAAGSTIDLNGIGGLSMQDSGIVLVQSNAGINGNFNVTVNGAALSNTVDEDTYLVGTTRIDSSGNNLVVDVGLVWNSTENSSAHGMFNIASGETFTVDMALSDNATLAAHKYGWNGQDLTKKGDGTLVLNAVNTHTGLTDVTAGKLIIGDDASKSSAMISGHVNVRSGATLGGHGIVGGNVILAGGATISPGNSFGTLTVGNITFNPGSTYLFEADENGNADKIVATGTATLNGGVVNFSATSGSWKANYSYEILAAAGGVVGTFDGVTSNFAFLNPALTYTGNSVFLNLQRNNTGMGSIGSNPNQVGVGNSIGSLGANHPVYQAIVGLDTATAKRAYDNLSGEVHASVAGALLSNSRYVRTAVNQHLQGQSYGAIQNTPDTSHNLWVGTWAHDGRFSADHGAGRTDNKGGGFLIGLDLPVQLGNIAVIGVAAGYERTKVDVGGIRNSNADVDAYHVAAYSAASAGPVDLRGGVGYTWLSSDTKRHVWVNGVQGENKADYNGSQVQVFIEGSHTFDLTENASLSPYANLAYTHIDMDSFTETGSQAALHGDSYSNSVTATTLGVRGQMQVGAQNQHTIYADLGWQHYFGDDVPQARLNFAGGSSFGVNGAGVGRNSAVIGVGADFQLRPNSHLSVGYEGVMGSQVRDHSLKLQLNWQF